MIDQQLARLRTHRSNIQRYRNLLKTNLTESERQFVQRRLTEEQSNRDWPSPSPVTFADHKADARRDVGGLGADRALRD
jgi:hypothetical protein